MAEEGPDTGMVFPAVQIVTDIPPCEPADVLGLVLKLKLCSLFQGRFPAVSAPGGLEAPQQPRERAEDALRLCHPL